MEIPLSAFRNITTGIYVVETPNTIIYFVTEGIYKATSGDSTHFLILEGRLEISNQINATWIHPTHHSSSFFDCLLHKIPPTMLQGLNPHLTSFDKLQILLQQQPFEFWYNVRQFITEAFKSMKRVASFEPFLKSRCYIPNDSWKLFNMLFKFMKYNGSELANIPFTPRNFSDIAYNIEQWLLKVSDDELGKFVQQHDVEFAEFVRTHQATS